MSQWAGKNQTFAALWPVSQGFSHSGHSSFPAEEPSDRIGAVYKLGIENPRVGGSIPPLGTIKTRFNIFYQ